jgi:hypothetical protein
MKIYLQYCGGKEPGLELQATRRDFQELGRKLLAATDAMEKDGKEESQIELGGISTAGGTSEWLAFRVVKEVDASFARHVKAVRWRFRALAIFWSAAFVIGVFYFVCR